MSSFFSRAVATSLVATGAVVSGCGLSLGPKTCDPATFEDRCDGRHAVTCAGFDDEGTETWSIDDTDCGSYAFGEMQCVMQGGPTCIPAGLRACSLGAAVASGSFVGVADVDGDGAPDLVLSDSVLLRRGEGFTSLPSRAPGRIDDDATGLLGDFDGDRKVDWLSIGFDAKLTVYLGRGDGTFGDGLETSATAPWDGTYVVDVNHDGRADVVSSTDSEIDVLLGMRDGTLTRAPASSLGSLAPATGGDDYGPLNDLLGVADVTGDGALDVLVRREADGSLHCAAGNGDGTFSAPTPISLDAGHGKLEVQVVGVADFDADRAPDLLVSWVHYDQSSPYKASSVFLGDGRGSFHAATTLVDVPLPHDDGTGNQAVWQVGDVNGDGVIDLASNGFGAIIWLLGKGDGSFGAPSFLDVAGDKIEALADMDHDGTAEAVTDGSGTRVAKLTQCR